MKGFYLLIILSFFGNFSFSQDSVIVVVHIVDDRYEDPIQNVTAVIDYGEDKLIRTANSKGQFSFKVQKDVRINFGLTHPRFVSITSFKKISAKESSDTLNFTFSMKADKTQILDEVVIAAPGVPIDPVALPDLHIQDFEVLPDGRFILLTYPKQLKKGSELILYDTKIVNNFIVPGQAIDLVRDYRGNSHVVCTDNVLGIYVDGNRLEISNLNKEYFTKYVAPIVDTNASKMYFSNFNPDYPAFEYFAFDQLDSTYSEILGIKDDLMMELYRSEYKWVDIRTKLWAKNLEIQTGVDAEIYVGANYFTQSLYYKELYAPLFHRNDSLFIFDYYKDLLYTFNVEGEVIDSVSIYHHYQPKRTGWKKELIQDRVTGQIYAVFDRAGYTYLGWVDTKTGEISEQVKLEYRYAEKIAVEGNFVYYIYRPFESPLKKNLWKERLPYHFGHSTVPDGDDLVEDESKPER